MTTERVRVPANQQQISTLKTMLGNILKNRAVISIIAASIVMLLSQLTMQQMANYVYPNFYNNAQAQSAAGLTMMIGMILAAPLAKPLSKKFGKAEVSVVANIMSGIVCVVLFILRPQNVWVYVAFQTLCFLGLGIFAMVSWALITDVIDYSEIRNGIREDGSIYAVYSFARKLGQAASAGISGALLSLIGYSQATAFDNKVVNGIFDISTLVPAAGFLILAAILWFWYPLHKRQVDQNVAQLKAKHQREE
ncbi:MAG: MFS transporter [Eubacteriales bacterium]|nr:MFS transporter [Eubacteriales bacterium]MDD3198327.1 MFS transporter [Eubacteriales bacterium]MDD4683102.1 MFS transporter [Eubacteriales bacterium]